MTVPGKYVKPLVLYDGDKANGKVISNTYDSVNNTSTIVFSVSHFSSYTVVDEYEVVTVSTEAELIEKMEDGYSVKLGKDITMSENKGVTLPESGAVSLDLNGYKITFNLTKDKFGFNYYDVFTVYDSSEEGYGGIKTDAGTIFYTPSETASLTINKGNFEVGSGTAIGTEISYVGYPNLTSYGNILINGGTFTSTKAGEGSSADLIEISAELTVNGGTFGEVGSTSSTGTQIFHLIGGSAVLNNGTFASGQAYIIESLCSTVTVNGGSYKGTSSSGHPVYLLKGDNGGPITVNGGYFEVTTTDTSSQMFSGAVTVNDGTFKVNGSNCYLTTGSDNITINGGKFNITDGAFITNSKCTGLIIEGGTFETDGVAFFESVGMSTDVKINGGEFTATEGAIVMGGIEVTGETKGKITIGGGTFNTKAILYVALSALTYGCDYTNMEINGGIFTAEETAIFQDGVKLTEDGKKVAVITKDGSNGIITINGGQFKTCAVLRIATLTDFTSYVYSISVGSGAVFEEDPSGILNDYTANKDEEKNHWTLTKNVDS